MLLLIFAMLFILVVMSLLSVTFAEGDGRPIVHLEPLVLKVVKDAAVNCVKELEVNQEVSDKFFKLRIDDNEDTKKFLYCLCRKTNYADEDGHLNEAVVQLFEGNDRKDEVQRVINNCKRIKENDKFETIFKNIQCFYRDTPVLVGQ